MTSRKIIDIANSLDFVNDYNNSGITGNNSRISTSEYGQLFLYSTNSSVNSSTATIVLYNGGLSINNTIDTTSITSGGSLTIRGGASFEKSIRVGNSGYITNVISTNSSISTLNVIGLTAGNINFTGDLYKNGSLYVSSQWTSSGGTLSYTNGNVGIATTSPNYTLDVNGTINSTNIISTNITTSVLNASGITSGNINFTGNLYKNGNIYISSQWKDEANGALSFTGGNIGIGNTSPDYKLDITGNLRVNSTDASIIISRNNNNVLQIQNSLISGNSSIQFADNSGNTKLFTGYANANSSIVSLAGSSYILSDTTVSLKLVAGNQTDIPVILNANDNSVSITTTTDATNIYSGALKVSGGAGIAKKLYVGDDLHVNRDLYVSGSINGAAASSSTYGYITLTATDDSINLSTGSLVTFGGITIQTTADSNSTSDGGSFLTAGGASIQKTLRVGNGIISENISTTNISTNNINVLNLSTGNLMVNNLNLGISNMFSGSFIPNNNTVTLSNVDGLSFSNTDTRSFTVNLSVSIESSGGNLYETFVLDGTQNNSQWSLYTTSYGDNSGIVFSITNLGQIQYTSTNISGFTNSIFRFFVNQIANTGTYIYAGLQTQGTLIINNIQILSTADSNIGVNNGSLYLAGGATVSKTLYADNITSSNVKVTNITSNNIVGVNVNGTNSTITNAVHTTLSTGTLTATTSVSSAALFATNASVGGLNASGLSALVNAIATNASVGVLIASTGITTAALLNTGLISSANLAATTSTIPNIIHTNVTTGVLVASTGITTAALLNTGLISSANLAATTSTIPNIIHTNVTTGVLVASTGITTAALLNTGLISSANLAATTSTIPNIIHTNVTTGVLVASTGITTAALLNTGLISSANLAATTATIPNIIVTNISAGTLVGTTITGGNLSLSGNLIVAGTLTTVNITSTNILNTNISIGTISATGLSSLTNVTATNASVGVLIASTGITAASAQITNVVGTTISAGTLTATNINVTTISAATALVSKNSPELIIQNTDYVNNGTSGIKFANTGVPAAAAYIRCFLAGTNVHDLQFIGHNGSSNVTAMTIKGSGNVGIGTTVPANAVDIINTVSQSNAPFLRLGNSAGGSGNQVGIKLNPYSGRAGGESSQIIAVDDANSSSHLLFYTAAAGASTTSTERMRITNNGNVGIGTNNPGESLDVRGNLRVGGSTQGNYICFFGTTLDGNYNNAYIGERVYDSGTERSELLLFKGNDLSSAPGPDRIRLLAAEHRFDTYTSDLQGAFESIGSTVTSNRMIITTSGNVGIGTTSPSYTLDVTGTCDVSTSITTAALYSTNITATNVVATTISSGTILGTTLISSANVAASLITTGTLRSSSIVLSGSSSQVVTYPLTNGLENAFAYYNNTLASGDATRWVVGLNVQTGVGNYGFWNSSLGRPALMITSTGNIGIGTTSPATTLDVNGDVRGKSLLISGNGTYTTGSIYSDSSYGMMYRSNTSNPTLSHFAWSDYADNKLLYLSSTAGNLICTGDVTAFGSLSDSRLKENISSISNDTALETVRLLRPVTFNWRGDIFNQSKRGTLDVGFIAQEVEQLVPLAVSEYDEINTGKVYKNIKHERLIPYLVGAIQRLDRENDKKQIEINNLSKQLNDLKNTFEKIQENTQQYTRKLDLQEISGPATYSESDDFI
jgi:trimeric autotransporter adhesin